jgi:hypothetical protein
VSSLLERVIHGSEYGLLRGIMCFLPGKDGVLTMSSPIIRSKDQLDLMLSDDFFEAGKYSNCCNGSWDCIFSPV